MATDAGSDLAVNALPWLTASETGAALARGRLSCSELVQALLERIHAHDPRLNSFIACDAEPALEAARAVDREIAAGRRRGPLHGIPYAVKDIVDVAGQATTCHSKLMLGHIARRDAEVVARLRAAGAIMLGKLALHEFAFGGPCFDLPFPPARNPWNPDHYPGGSSSGSGAAVAAGFVAFALGTDTAGSIRNPAGACGVVGLKPTYDLVSRQGIYPLSFTLDHVGPIARSVADIAVALDAMADFGPTAAARVERGSFGADLGRGVRGLRIGFVRHFHERDLVADPEMAAGLEEAARVLRQEGAAVRDQSLSSLQSFTGPTRVILLSESWTVHAQAMRERPADFAQSTRRKLMCGAFLSAEDYVRAQQQRHQLMAAVDDAFRDVDILMTVNSHDPACRIDDPEALARAYPRQARAPFNLTGHPALSMICGLSSTRLPLSLQFVARHHDEVTLLRVAAAFERATPWHDCHPPF